MTSMSMSTLNLNTEKKKEKIKKINERKRYFVCPITEQSPVSAGEDRFGRRNLNSSRVPLRTGVFFFNDDHLSDYLSALSSLRPKNREKEEEEEKGRKKNNTRNRNRNKEETYRTIGSSTRRNRGGAAEEFSTYLLEISITEDE